MEDEKPPERYRRLMRELDEARRLADDRLPAGEENRRVSELDRTWWAMTDDEQDEYELEQRKGKVEG